MLKYECNKGTASISGSGSTQELCADVLACIFSVWEGIREQEQKDTFRDVIKAAINENLPFCDEVARQEKVKKKAEKVGSMYKVLDEIKDLLGDAGFNTGDEDEAE